MTKRQQSKKRIVTSYNNLSPELQQLVKEQYPNGFNDNMMRIDKGADDFFYAIVLETEETNYLIKIDVKVDDHIDDDDDKNLYDDDKEFYGDDEMKDSDSMMDKDGFE